jgi:LuxR family transcriptional regulator, maltose regulon positive regulatory protein
MIYGGTATPATATVQIDVAAPVASDESQRRLKLKFLLARALHADRQLQLALGALADALGADQDDARLGHASARAAAMPDLLRQIRLRAAGVSDVDGLRLPPDIDQWIRERVAARPEPEAAANSPASDPLAVNLTRQESRILELLASGFSNNGMAKQLFVSESTVRTHLRSINCKLQAGSRTQAVAIARKLGLI